MNQFNFVKHSPDLRKQREQSADVGKQPGTKESPQNHQVLMMLKTDSY